MSCLAYIRERYRGYCGVPKQYVDEELQCSPDELIAFKTYVKDMGVKPNDDFIPFDIFADGLDCMFE